MKFLKKHSVYVLNVLLIGIIAGFAVSTLINKDGHIVRAGKTELADHQYTFRAIAGEALPFVVEIMTVEVKVQEMPKGYSWPFNFIMPEEDEGETEKQEYETEGLGSGVIVRQNGNKYFALTNNHVIGKANKVSVRLYDKEIIEAKIVGVDERKDLAMISFESEKKQKVAKLGDSDKIYVGDWVLAVGSPLGYESTVTAGIVSAIGRRGPEDNINDFIQTDASINQGNSGGALVNLDGEVIGINTWIATTTGTSIGLGFSIPVNNVKRAIDEFMESGTIRYGWLGVSISDVDTVTEKEMGLSGYTGAFVHNVYSDSPAGKAGLQPGDYIISVDGEAVSDYKHFTRLIGEIREGDIVQLSLIRNGEIIEIKALIELRKNKEQLIAIYDSLWPGFTAIPLDEEIKKELNIKDSVNGVIISVETGSVAFSAGLKDLDIITSINDNEINNVVDFYATINDKDNSYSFNVIRNNNEIGIILKK